MIIELCSPKITYYNNQSSWNSQIVNLTYVTENSSFLTCLFYQSLKNRSENTVKPFTYLLFQLQRRLLKKCCWQICVLLLHWYSLPTVFFLHLLHTKPLNFVMANLIYYIKNDRILQILRDCCRFVYTLTLHIWTFYYMFLSALHTCHINQELHWTRNKITPKPWP